MTRHPVLRPGNTLRLGGATDTVGVAGFDLRWCCLRVGSGLACPLQLAA
jgi:hypothetical protein